MTPVEILIDTSSLPRGVAQMTPEIERLSELVETKLVRIHMSVVTVREWESQIVDEFLKSVDCVSKSVETLRRQKLSTELSCRRILDELASQRVDMRSNAAEAAKKRVQEVIQRLGVIVVGIEPDDGKNVIDRYFVGDRPFKEPKNRMDFPDAFIFCAAERVAKQTRKQVLFVCKDRGLRNALAQIDAALVYEDLKGLLSSEAMVAASEKLPIAKFWTGPRSREVIKAVASQKSIIKERLKEWADEELLGFSVSDPSIPEDNNEARIAEVVGGIEDLDLKWDKTEDMGPGWLEVPFKFNCELGLEFFVYRADSFHLDDWVSVSFPDDYEADHYYEASGYRIGSVSGLLSLRFTLEELQTDEIEVPDFQVEDVEIELRD